MSDANLIERLARAEQTEEAARKELADAIAAKEQALKEVANGFLDLYLALPAEARNKVRHAINTSVRNPGD